ncbi:MAG: Bifunctional protein: zinc-containing alcohol dehydrogenase; quinone oxidoreductase (NADPH:quinone reductase); Similar to arginate lyase [uncultured Rubrobacteraceae bacterium]|uniref:Bifunctional protein: zinc-containing alcohol dehydrogenase quinone oxidoreductase ( NADPH:quinone reductase) Similar to arginate lyase n=1 Tax=uncultured Rubrobacteraceae bacterium TaxID=349277 RepID=A0A6J4NWY4_9ACTN|nr:MAG: Bifunctional protein: zinc-containing alcohol dehydrogenase; quinone oxidoreductase (NADPH:quinone reductase); Similar to arginate lyase [uncultured Rubrobacteraceae bacterium]
MRAMVTPRFGGVELFEERDLERPQPGPGEVLVRVVVAGTNPVDTKLRADGSFAGLEPPVVLGSDVSGVIEEVGAGVQDLTAGDEVYYTPEIFGPGSNGGYAGYHLARAGIVAIKPPSLSHEEAAAVPLAGGTAYEVIVRRLKVRVGETVLIHGGAGGVGSFAVQISRSAGARVIATAGPDNQQTLKELGADVALDYTQTNVTDAALEETGGTGVDAVFDCVGGDTVVESIPATRPYGRLATILGAQGDLTPLYVNNQTLHGVLLMRERARLDEMSLMLQRGQMKPLVDEVLDLNRVGEAHERLESGHGRGKVVLKV